MPRPTITHMPWMIQMNRMEHDYVADLKKSHPDVKLTDATGASSYAYDPFGELTSATNGAQQTVGYSYNADGEPSGITYPLPDSATWARTNTVGYGYDHADQLTSVTDFTGNQIAITPNADGLPSSQPQIS